MHSTGPLSSYTAEALLQYLNMGAARVSGACPERKANGLASKKWTAIQAALMCFFAVCFSKATGEMYPRELWRLFGL